MKLAVSALLLSACTVLNPSYDPSSGGGLGSGGGVDSGVLSDGSVVIARDLTPTGPVADLAPVCSGSQRQCLATSGSASCMGGNYVLDRKCPMGSMCASGYCQAPGLGIPPAGVTCDFGQGPAENNCFSATGGDNGLSCQPFISNLTGDFTWVCTPKVGAGLPGDACQDGSQCRSGFCGSNGTCFRTCHTDQDCPQSQTKHLTCASVDLVVEGKPLQADSCIP
jgi:hypothetical protein